MIDIISILLSDWYKQVHRDQYHPNTTKVVSYWTPRGSRLKSADYVVVAGIQAFIKEMLIEDFNKQFFSKSKEYVREEYEKYFKYCLRTEKCNPDPILALHDIGYLPLKIRAIPEGSVVNVKIPLFEVSNTFPEFFWLTNVIESLISCYIWHLMVSATVGKMFRDVVNKYYDIAADDDVKRSMAISDFSMRGQHSYESAIRSSAMFCLSFLGTATVPTVKWLEQMYNCDCTKEPVVFGAYSTEHSVTCSNFAIYDSEEPLLTKLLTEIYPDDNFSYVADSYDYWNFIQEIIPRHKEEIKNHKGKFLVRPDSGNPADIICGLKYPVESYVSIDSVEDIADLLLTCNDHSHTFHIKMNDKFYDIEKHIVNGKHKADVYEYTVSPDGKGSLEILMDTFGCTVNSKGYKVLPSCIGLIYGDGITIERAKDIYQRLIEKKIAPNNVVFGVGSFSFMCIEEDGELKPFTRDTFNFAMKATYCEVGDRQLSISKNPKTDLECIKKSQSGCCVVTQDDDGYHCVDGYTFGAIERASYNKMTTIFENGLLQNETTLNEVRNRLNNGNF